MMKVSKLSSLHGVARIRKCAVLLEKAEMNLVRVLPSEEICAHPDFAYACELARFLTKDSETTEDVRQAADTFLAAAASAAAAADRAAAGLPP
ncbi:MAG: hypothetical protein LLF89_04970, partial [Spirochaetaceae bacterium]|nr:hypothetical protein [Spirochaetaceae bacterium]